MSFTEIANILISSTENYHDTVAYNKKIGGEWKSITYGVVYDINNEFTDGLITLSIIRNNR